MKHASIQHNKEVYAIWLLAALGIAQVAAYSYLVNSSVAHVVARMSHERDTSSRVSHVAELEREYFTLQDTVTTATARSLGYVDARHVKYVSHTGEPVQLLSERN